MVQSQLGLITVLSTVLSESLLDIIASYGTVTDK